MNKKTTLDEEQKNYYYAVFDILERLLPDILLDKIITEFKEHCALVHRSSDSLWPKIKDIVQKKGPFQSLWHEMLENKLLIISIFFSILPIIFLFSNSNKTNITNQRTLSVRSELLIPTEVAFLKRSSLINRIEKELNGPGNIRTVVLVGVGGSGKTTLARYVGRSQVSSVLWEINAETKDSLISSFKDLAYALAHTKEQKDEIDFIQKIQDQEKKENQMLFLVKEMLKENGNWFLIYDNVESFSEIKNYFPQDADVWGNGKVIITTRDGNIKDTSYLSLENIIQIEELTQTEALNLFSKILYRLDPEKLSQDQKERAINFLHHIPPFPLDISVAAYYIKNTQITYEQYLERIKDYGQSFENVQKSLLKETTDYTRTRYGIITSSLERLISINPDFKELLLFICLLDSQNIPKELLETHENKLDIDNFVHNLKKYSLIVSKSPNVLSLHRSTQIIGQVFLLNLLNREENKAYIGKIVTTMKNFYELYSEKKQETLITFIPHLEALIRNLEKTDLQYEDKENQKEHLFLLLGRAHRGYSNNIILAQQYLTYVYMLQKKFATLSNQEFVNLLKDLGKIHVVLNEYDKSISYSLESIKLCEKIDYPAHLLAENLKNMGVAYEYKDNFEKAKECLESALNKIENLNTKLKKDLESEIYGELANLYSGKYLNRKEGYEAEKYALKALEILNASKLFSKSKNIKKEKISCEIARSRMILGRVYNRLNQYDIAVEQGFQEAEYIIENSLDNCTHNLLKARLFLGKGEALLRNKLLEAAENVLTNSINISKNLVGEVYALIPRIFRAEAKIRLRKLVEAYEDCSFVFKVGQKPKNNYFNLMHLTCFYHAAIIKYKQGALEKSLEHFSDFFKGIKTFCQSFLGEKEYQELEAQGVFVEITYDKNQIKEQIKQCLQRSAAIFTTIYGAEHPFVRDYVLENSHDKNKTNPSFLEVFIKQKPLFKFHI